MHNKFPLVSIIMPAFNAEKFISESIISVIKQTYTNWELLIINDGSIDKTSEIISKFSDHRIILFEQKNAGVANARNIGIQNSKGCYIAFLDSDDTWLEDKLKIQTEFMILNSNIGFTYTNYFSFYDNKLIKNKQLHPFKIDKFNEKLLVFNFIASLTVMVKSNLIKELEGFDNKLHGPEDWDLWIRISQKTESFYIDKKLAIYREHNQGISKNKSIQLKEEFKVLKKHVLKTENLILIKSAMWFYNLKLSNYHLTNKNFILFIIYYLKMIKQFPFKAENYTYPIITLINYLSFVRNKK
jgi:glycosyltransferase involved in cell wall biosynthesis